MLAEILPAGVSSVETFTESVPPEEVLFAEEAALLTHASAKRRNEFAAVRACARRALGELGMPPVALLPGAGGAPQWPQGVVGSMTHCTGYRGAALARSDELRTIGIDAEPAVPLPAGVLGLVASPREQAMVARLGEVSPMLPWDRLLFCAKEAVYKAWYPMTQEWLRFRDATVEIDAAGTFSAVVFDEHLFTGRWVAREGLLLTAVTRLS